MPTGKIDLTRRQAIHIVGAGGAGMNAIGVVLAEMGHQVSGSDLRESLGITRLSAMGAQISIGHDEANVGGVDLLTHSTAIPPDNVELAAARSRQIPLWSRAEILRAICELKRTVAVAGTHGKTTTSSMLALCLVSAGLSPSFVVGGDLNEIGSSAVWDTDGDIFVVEADESDGTFEKLGATVAIITNIEADHLNHYGDIEALERAFERFAAAASLAIVCADDARSSHLASQRLGECRVITYGTDPDADYRLTELVSDRKGVRFSLRASAKTAIGAGELGEFAVPLAGRHNALNATASIASSLELAADLEPVRTALERFGGVARRFELRGSAGDVSFIDDYAHLPTEVSCAVAAAKDGGWERVVAVFQPHRFSRTADLWGGFADAFTAADLIVLTGIYSAGEQPQPGITGELIARAVLDAHPYASVAYIPNWSDLRAYLNTVLRPGDLCLTLGAGDLTTLPDLLLADRTKPA